MKYTQSEIEVAGVKCLATQVDYEEYKVEDNELTLNDTKYEAHKVYGSEDTQNKWGELWEQEQESFIKAHHLLYFMT